MNGLEDDYRALLNKVAAKRAVERFLLTFVALCVVGTGVLLFFENRSLTTEVKGQQQEIHDNDRHFAQQQQEIQTETSQIDDYIQCIAEFFAQPDRSNLKLNNLQACKFAHASQPSTSSSSPSSSNLYAVVPTQPQTTNPNAQQPTTSEPPRPSTSNSQPHTGSGTGSNPQPTPAPVPLPVPNPTTPVSFLQHAVSSITGLVNGLL